VIGCSQLVSHRVLKVAGVPFNRLGGPTGELSAESPGAPWTVTLCRDRPRCEKCRSGVGGGAFVLRRPALLAAVAASAALLTGCGTRAGKEPQSVAATSPPSSAAIAASPSLTPRAIADRDAVAAYSGMLGAWVVAAKTSNPDEPQLRTYAQGRALKMLINVLYGRRMQKMVVLGEPGTAPRATDARPVDVPTTVVVTDCLDSTRWLEYRESGELWDDEPGGRHELQAVVVRTEAGWKVDVFVIRDVTC
jgi:hypothetical protein